MDAEVVIKFRLDNICSEQELLLVEMTFEELVRFLLEEEGLSGFTHTGIGAGYDIQSIRMVA